MVQQRQLHPLEMVLLAWLVQQRQLHPLKKTIYLKTKNYEENDFDGSVGDCVGCQLGADDALGNGHGET